jgi:hypothetical protein
LIFVYGVKFARVKWVTVTRAWRVFRLQDLVDVQEVRGDTGSTVRAGNYNRFYGKGKENYQLGTGFLVHHKIVSAVKRV